MKHLEPTPSLRLAVFGFGLAVSLDLRTIRVLGFGLTVSLDRRTAATVPASQARAHGAMAPPPRPMCFTDRRTAATVPASQDTLHFLSPPCPSLVVRMSADAAFVEPCSFGSVHGSGSVRLVWSDARVT